MSASTTVPKTAAFPDEPEAVLDYLVARTSETVGRRVDRSSLVVLADVTRVDVVEGPQFPMANARLAVERRLAGPVPSGELTLAYPRAAVGTAPADPEPTLAPGDRGVFFLRELDADAPYTPLVPSPAYRLPGGDADVARDDPRLIDETAKAVEWYAGLPGDWAPRRAELISALDSPNPRIARAAARALAESGETSAADVLEEVLAEADDDLRVRIMLALWRLGRRERAIELLLSAYAVSGKDAWLAQWGLAPSVDAQGRREAVLFGPDPSETRGD